MPIPKNEKDIFIPITSPSPDGVQGDPATGPKLPIETKEKVEAGGDAPKDDRLLALWAQRTLRLSDALAKKGLEKRAKTLQNKVLKKLGLEEIKASDHFSNDDVFDLVEAAFNPNQKRYPKGHPNGGEWVNENAEDIGIQSNERKKRYNTTRSRLEQWFADVDTNEGGSISIVRQESAQSETYTESGKTAEEYSRDASIGEILSEEARLIAIAKEEGFFLSEDQISRLVDSDSTSGGGEHDVFFHFNDEKGVIIRRTINDSYGFPHKSTSQYLRRLEQYNEAFPSTQIQVIGVSQNKRGNGVIWTAQPYVHGREFDSESQVREKLKAKGFKTIGPAKYEHENIGIIIEDAHSGNLLETEHGDIFPIDVIVSRRKNEDDRIAFSDATPKQRGIISASDQVKPALDRYVDTALEGLTGVTREWLAPVRPAFERLAALSMAKQVTDEDFIQSLSSAGEEMPELFGKINSEALQEAFKDSMGAAMLNGSVSRYKPEKVEAGNWIFKNGHRIYIRDESEKVTQKKVRSAIKDARDLSNKNAHKSHTIHKLSTQAMDRIANISSVSDLLTRGKMYRKGHNYSVNIPIDTIKKNDKLNKNENFLSRENLVPIRDYDYEKIPLLFEEPDKVSEGKSRSNGTPTIKFDKDYKNGISLEAAVSGKKGRFTIVRIVRKK